MGIDVTTDPAAIDMDRLVEWLGDSYWASGRSLDTQARAIKGSLCFSALADGSFAGFCRVVTDGATFGWLCDVIVDPERRGTGIGKSLMKAVSKDPQLNGVRMVLATRDAHRLYEQYGFTALGHPEDWMGRGFRAC